MAALRRGDRRALVVDADRYAFARDADDGAPAIVLLSRGAEPAAIDLPAGSTTAPGWYKDALTGQRFELAAHGGTIDMEPLSMRVLVPETSPCGATSP